MTLPLLLLATGCTADGDASTQWDAAVAVVESYLADHDVPGATLAVVSEGETFATGLGVRTDGGSDPVTEDTLFPWFAVTQVHTAQAAMRLVDDGALDLDAAIGTYAPELALSDGSAPAGVSVGRALSHTTGLEEIHDWTGCESDADLAAWVDRYDPDPWLPAGPARWHLHNDAAFALVGRAVETASGLPFEEAMQQLVFEPNGMETATLDACAGQAPTLGLLATATDVAGTMAVHLDDGGSALSAASAEAMRDQVDTGLYADPGIRAGFGLYHDVREPDLDVLFHSGAGSDGSAAVLLLPDHDWGLAIALNSGADALEVARDAMYAAFPDAPASDRADRTDPSGWADRYAGTYEDPWERGTTVVEADGDTLWVSFVASGERYELVQVGGDHFVFDDATHGPVDVVFRSQQCNGVEMPAGWLLTRFGVASRSFGCDD